MEIGLPLLWLFFVFLSCLIGYTRNRAALGLFFGLLLGPIACLLIFFAKAHDEPASFADALLAFLGAILTGAAVVAVAAITIVPALQREDAEEERRLAERNRTHVEIEKREEESLKLATPRQLTAVELAAQKARVEAEKAAESTRREYEKLAARQRAAAVQNAEIMRKYGSTQ